MSVPHIFADGVGALSRRDLDENFASVAGMTSVLSLGVKGDGVTNDAAAINAANLLGIPLYYPATPNGYLIGSTVTILVNSYFDGFFKPSLTIGANNFAVVIGAGAFPERTTITGLYLSGSGPLRAGLINGIRIDRANCVLNQCYAFILNYGIVPRMYGITLNQCGAPLCNTALSAYARDVSHEINALHISGGYWDSCVVRAMYIGDTTWPDAMAPGNPHGVKIDIDGDAYIDGAEIWVDNAYTVNISVYGEGTISGQFVKIGGAGDGLVKGITVTNCYFSNAEYGVKCFSAVDKLSVSRNFCTNVRKSAMYEISDLYPSKYERGVNVASFTQGQEVHTGFRSLAIGTVTFDNYSIDYQGLIGGVQSTQITQSTWYPNGTYYNAAVIGLMNASNSTRYYSAPSLAKSGVVAGTVFTFNTLADCAAFNGGDRLVTAPAGATYVRSVDYVAGTMVIDGGVTPNGAATVSQVITSFRII